MDDNSSKNKGKSKTTYYNLDRIKTNEGWQVVKIIKELTEYGKYFAMKRDTMSDIYDELEIKRLKIYPAANMYIYRTRYRAVCDWAYFKENGKVGAINNIREIIIKPKYDSLNHEIYTYPKSTRGHYNGVRFPYMLLFKFEGKWGVMNHKGEEVISPTYDNLIPVIQEKENKPHMSYPINLGFIVEVDGKFGVVSIENKITVPIEMDKIELRRSPKYGAKGIGANLGVFLLLEKNGLLGAYGTGKSNKNVYISPVFKEQFQDVALFDDYPVVVFFDGDVIKGYADKRGVKYFKE